MQILTNPANAEKLMESLRRSDLAAMDGGIIQRQMEPTFYWVNLDSLAMFGSMTGGF